MEEGWIGYSEKGAWIRWGWGVVNYGLIMVFLFYLSAINLDFCPFNLNVSPFNFYSRPIHFDLYYICFELDAFNFQDLMIFFIAITFIVMIGITVIVFIVIT